MIKPEYDAEVGRILGIKSAKIVMAGIRFGIPGGITVELLVIPTQKQQSKLRELATTSWEAKEK